MHKSLLHNELAIFRVGKTITLKIAYYLIANDLHSTPKKSKKRAHLQSSVFKLSKDLIDSIHEEDIVAYTS